jgi:hypothetical protein
VAPTNEYLNNDDNRQRLTEVDPHLVRCSSTWYAGEEPTLHFDFERAVELGRLQAFLDRFNGADFADGKVTLGMATEAVYSYEDPYLLGRMRGHLSVGRGDFNVRYTDGTAYHVLDDDTVARDDKDNLARRWLQERADTRRAAVERRAGVEARGVEREAKRATKLAPASVGELDSIKHRWGHEVPALVEQQTRKALGTPKDDDA